MPVACSHCNEELLGAVNRCWRCGAKFSVAYDGRGVPPVRCAPLVGTLHVSKSEDALPDGVWIAELKAPISQENATADVTTEVVEAAVSANRTFARRGSPFAAGSKRGGVSPSASRSAAVREFQLQDLFSIASLAVSVIALLLCGWSEFAALAASSLGIFLAMFGLYSERRTIAAIAVAVGSLGLAISGYLTVVAFYTMKYGISPWSTN